MRLLAMYSKMYQQQTKKEQEIQWHHVALDAIQQDALFRETNLKILLRSVVSVVCK